MAYPIGNLFIEAGDGRIEGILKEPRVKSGGAALVLHPQPLHGGTMHNKVVFHIASALSDAGLVTLRINFRGVGQSTGAHDYGHGEQEDASLGLGYLEQNFPDDPLTLAGFSFGARVGLEVGVSDMRVRRLIGVGTPVDMYDFGFLKRCRKPILLIHGENDEFGRVEQLRALAREIGSETSVSLEVVPGTGHFFESKLDDVKRLITEWILRESGLDGGSRLQ